MMSDNKLIYDDGKLYTLTQIKRMSHYIVLRQTGIDDCQCLVPLCDFSVCPSYDLKKIRYQLSKHYRQHDPKEIFQCFVEITPLLEQSRKKFFGKGRNDMSFASLKKEICLCFEVIKSDSATECSKQEAQDKLRKIYTSKFVPCLTSDCKSLASFGWYCSKHQQMKYESEFLEEWK